MQLITIRPPRPVGAVLIVAVFLALDIKAQDATDVPPYQVPGRLIDVGGWRLHLNCTGRASQSQPTVILESGIGDFSLSKRQARDRCT